MQVACGSGGCVWVPSVLGLGVVALTARSVDKEMVVCVGLWFVAWACVACLGLCGLRERGSYGLRAPGAVSLWSGVARSRCVVQGSREGCEVRIG